MNKVISKDGTSIAYEKSGSGEPLILIDGALCYRSFGPMKKFASLLSNNFTVYWYDRRGRGDSGDSPTSSPDREVEDIEALINETGGAAFLLGLSSGAALALRVASKGLNIKKMALYEPPYVWDKNSGKPAIDHEAALKKILATGNRGKAVKYFMVTMVGAPAIAAFVMQLMPMWKKLKGVAHTLPYDSAIMGDWSVPEENISSIKTPTLIAGGGKSPANLQDPVKLIAKLLSNGTLKMLEGQTHNVKAEVLIPEVMKFFKK
ncbi:MAG: alpha/beta hydrolase [Bacteroidota bacterium]|nr:alpha/beta hydrolase [Bacteroidota bacterium]